MPFKPNDITRDHILSAISKIEAESIDLIPSTKWDVIINDKYYPPKEVMRLAHEAMNGERVWEYGGGEATNQFFKKFEFEIQEKNPTSDDPLLELIETYKKEMHQSNEELYKWELLGKFEGRPNLKATDLLQELKGIDYSNLIYHTCISVIHDIAKNQPLKYKDALSYLFDEEVSLSEKTKTFPEMVKAIYREISKDDKLNHFHDERTMATLLTFYNPKKYAFYKDSFYKKLCTLLNIPPQKKGEKYNHYMTLVSEFIEKYISEDDELLDLAANKIPPKGYSDPTHTLLAQDILYQTLDMRIGTKRRYWRVGTTEGDAGESYWEEMKTEQYIAIGWSALGDLSELNISTKKDIEKLLKEHPPYDSNNSLASRKAGEIYNFLEKINHGDIILAQEGSSIQGIGIVSGDYEYVEGKTFPHTRKVTWSVFTPSLRNEQGNRTTVYEVNNLSVIQELDSLLNISQQNQQRGHEDMKMPLNQILYGPPGTGKTHRIISEYFPKFTTKVEDSEQYHKELIGQYTWWQVVAATVYDLQSCNVTQILNHEFIKAKASISNQKSVRAMIWSMLQQHTKHECEHVKYAKRNDPLFFSKDENSIWTIDKNIVENDTPEIKAFLEAWNMSPEQGMDDKLRCYEFVTFHQSFTYEDFVEGIKPIMEGDEDEESSSIGYTIIDGVFKKICVRARLDEKNDYAIFIDEINRGNISQIFGELITLIEEDKREGKPNEIKLRLPYSKKIFSVPRNLYIIGTMNTADRSVEALDTALRRRFSFEEILPQPNLIKSKGRLKEQNGILNGIDLSDILATINLRIEKLKDKDHMIGHSYFMNVETLQDLKLSFQRCIIPLLQEYFYGDYGKIGLIIGASFFDENEAQDQNESEIFANFGDYNSTNFSNKPIYRLLDVNKFTDQQMVDAMLRLMNNGINNS